MNLVCYFVNSSRFAGMFVLDVFVRAISAFDQPYTSILRVALTTHGFACSGQLVIIPFRLIYLTCSFFGFTASPVWVLFA